MQEGLENLMLSFIVQYSAISGNCFLTSDSRHFVAQSTGGPSSNCIQDCVVQPFLVRLSRNSLNLLFHWTLATYTVHLKVQSKALRAPLWSTKLSCIWPTDCWIIGTALNANPPKMVKARNAVPRSQKGQTCWSSIRATVCGMGGLYICWEGERALPVWGQGPEGCLRDRWILFCITSTWPGKSYHPHIFVVQS